MLVTPISHTVYIKFRVNFLHFHVQIFSWIEPSKTLQPTNFNMAVECVLSVCVYAAIHTVHTCMYHVCREKRAQKIERVIRASVNSVVYC